MHEQILIIDFGSQFTQLIARRIRELNIYCEIHPFNNLPELTSDIKGVILSGSPASCTQPDAPVADLDIMNLSVPVLGLCYGAQFLAASNGGKVEKSIHREYGRANITKVTEDRLLQGIDNGSQVWMSHGDTILEMPEGTTTLAKTDSIPVAAYRFTDKEIYAVQFHPEVSHSIDGTLLLQNFTKTICGCVGDWTPAHFVTESVSHYKEQIGSDKVIMGLSGGVDSSVAAFILHRAIGDNLVGIFVNNGVLRKGEYEQVLEAYKGLGLNVIGVDASELFISRLNGVSDPETKRKIIGNTFIEVFDKEASKIPDAKWLGQGTIYPDVIESVSVNGPSATIKSHHNVGGLPDDMELKLAEPLRLLFKDEVRRIGAELGVPKIILERHPFPGPGLAIRIIGEITYRNVAILQEADAIFINEMKEFGIYNDIWQAGAIFLPVQSVGVMGDERTYENVIALRAVTSVDGMTADWADLPHKFLASVSNKIINQVKGINRVVYDISSKPPATIEWE
ncbi:MAG TPA: GMP synthase (glutamine-hydrolyzing) [Bacteroidetes bacterium]|jgi:GMP synthase (glutamine-hydrolysing)|nr:GMP synthase (glutamine-hydrolyzing) [Bacteroidota bacterium]